MQSTLPMQLGAAHDLRRLGNTVTGKMFLAVSATAFVALCAHVSVPLFFTPVPVTLQTMAVLLVGMALGPALGTSALVLYLAEGAVGLPVFSPHGLGGVAQLMGPTAGYLFSYPLAAAAAGIVVRGLRFGRSQVAAAVLAGLASTLLILSMGAGWIACLTPSSLSTAFSLGVLPFLPGEILKVAAAASAYSAFHKWQCS
jgi:biotin transport system substrate-specific component